jgi:hypothetical protein
MQKKQEQVKIEFLTARDLEDLLKVSKSSSYELVRQLNIELKSKGYLTFTARVRKDYFLKRIGFLDNEEI